MEVIWGAFGVVLLHVGSCQGGRWRVAEEVSEGMRKEHKYSDGGSLAPLFVVVVVIAALGVLAGLLARLCNGRHRAGNLDYDFEGWVEKKCASCIDGSLDLPPPESASLYPNSAHLLSNIAAIAPAPPPQSLPIGGAPPPPNEVYQQPPPSLVQIEIANGMTGAPPPPTIAGPLTSAASVNISATPGTGVKKKKKRKSGGGGGGGGGGAVTMAAAPLG